MMRKKEAASALSVHDENLVGHIVCRVADLYLFLLISWQIFDDISNYLFPRHRGVATSSIQRSHFQMLYAIHAERMQCRLYNDT